MPKKGECAMSQRQEFLSVLVRNAPVDEMPEDVLQGWIQNPKGLQRVLREALVPPQGQVIAEKQTLDWAKAYEALGMNAEYNSKIASLTISEESGLWTIPVIKDVTCNKVVQALRDTGCQVWLYADDMDKEVVENDRDPNSDSSYAVSVRATVEADEEQANKSANQLAKEGHKGITLLERLLLELAYFLTTGKHLDVKKVTLCSGSRRSDGRVPGVFWNSDYRGVFVYCCSPGYRRGALRSRSVVSLSAKTRESVS
jgi:hypothetical protein